MLELVGTRLLNQDLLRAPSFAEAVRRAVFKTRAQNLALDATTLSAVRLLAEAGIIALPLKGPRLAQSAFGDIGLRQSADIDLLVPAFALERSVALLRAQGYAAPTDPVGRDGLPHLHYALHQTGAPSIELHWRVHWYEDKFSHDLLARASAGHDGVPAPDEPDLLASLLLFYARDGFHGLRTASVIAALWDNTPIPAGAGALNETADRYPALRPALTAASEVLERFTGVPSSAWLTRSSSSGRRVSMAGRLATWSGVGNPDQLKAEISLVDGLLAPPGGLPAFLGRQVLATEETRWPLHAAKMLGRYSLALARMRMASSSSYRSS